MKLKNNFLAVITLIVAISWMFPEFWQIGITGLVSFFLAYLITKINRAQQKRN